jgi:hypothetical protein
MKTLIVERPEDWLSLQSAGPMMAMTTSVQAVQSTTRARTRRSQDAVRSSSVVEGRLTRSE